MRASSECRALRWKSMTSRMPLREVKISSSRKHLCLVFLLFHYLPCGSPSLSHLSACLYIGEDPLAGDQNDHDMDSIAGVLKLYFRGLDQALFPKEVFHDLISCVCKSVMIWSVFVSACICALDRVSNLLSVVAAVCSSDGEPPGTGWSH